MPSLALRDLQTSFFALVAGPDETAGTAGTLARHVVRGDGGLDAEARLRIYREMCLARLVDVLRDDYAPVVDALGSERFDAIARAYVIENPSVMPSIQHVSDRFPGFLETALPERPDLAERAGLERARLEVFSEADPRPLSLERLRSVPAEEWGGLELRPIAALRVITRSWGDGDAPPRPAPHVIRVWRRGFEIFQATVDSLEARALDRLLGGPTRIEEIGAMVAATRGPVDGARETGALLLRWIEDGIVEASV